MFRKFVLQPRLRFERPIEFEWDAKARAFRGPDGDRVAAMCDEANRVGSVTGDPMPTAYGVTDARANIADLAIVLDRSWVLDDDLAAARPKPAPDDDSEADYEPVY